MKTSMVAMLLIAACGREPDVPRATTGTEVPVVADMVTVMGGEFLGDEPECQDSGTARLKPEMREPVKMRTSSFRIDRRLATCDEIRACIASGKCANDPASPVVALSCVRGVATMAIDVAKGYCGSRGMLLPSRAQWQRAARGTDGRPYPTGAEPPTDCVATVENEHSPACLRVSPSGMEYKTRSFGEWTRDQDCTSTPNQMAPVSISLGTDRISHVSTIVELATARCVREM